MQRHRQNKGIRLALATAAEELGDDWKLEVAGGGRHSMMVATHLRSGRVDRIPISKGTNPELCGELMRRYCRQLLRGSRPGVSAVG